MMQVCIRRRVNTRHRQFSLDINLRSNAARIALYGPSGSGKTLTLKAIAGLMTPDAGHIAIGGDVLFDAANHVCLPAQARKLGYVPQEYRLFPHLTVQQNILFGLNARWYNRRRMAMPVYVTDWVHTLALADLLSHFPHQLSGGQQQRVALVRALAVQPRLLLLDEPLAALDTELKRTTRHMLAQVQQRSGIPSVVITHDPEDARALADHVFFLRNGRLVDDCPAQQLTER